MSDATTPTPKGAQPSLRTFATVAPSLSMSSPTTGSDRVQYTSPRRTAGFMPCAVWAALAFGAVPARRALWPPHTKRIQHQNWRPSRQPTPLNRHPATPAFPLQPPGVRLPSGLPLHTQPPAQRLLFPGLAAPNPPNIDSLAWRDGTGKLCSHIIRQAQQHLLGERCLST